MKKAESRKDSKGQIPVTVYTPESQLRAPGNFIRSMWYDLLASRELAWRLTVRDISARYRQSALGILWAFLLPLVTAALFIGLNRSAILNVGTTEIPYPVFVLFGTMLWQLFLDSLNAPLKAVTTNKAILAKVNMPREAIILSGIGQLLFDFSIRAIILAAIFVIYRIPLTWGLLLAPFAILMLMLLGITIGLALTPIGVLYTDIAQALTAITGLWFFITPVAYPVPEQGLLSVLMNLNPVTYLLNGARDIITLGTLSNVISVVVISVITILGLFVVQILYRLSLPILIERMSA
jgi:lipopolysaccharide transport system permease protein